MEESGAFLARGMNGLTNHFVLISSNIGTARIPEVENKMYVAGCFRAGQIPCHKAAKILGERYAQITCAAAHTPLHLMVERNLGSRHHDGIIIPSIIGLS
jgi:hypothetical protein